MYFFHLRDGANRLIDPEGRDLPDGTAASEAALREARALIAAEALRGRIDLDQRIEVEDADGHLVHRLEFRDAVTISRNR